MAQKKLSERELLANILKQWQKKGEFYRIGALNYRGTGLPNRAGREEE